MIRKLIYKILTTIINVLIDIREIVDKSEYITFAQVLKKEGIDICPHCDGEGVIPLNNKKSD